MWQKILQFLLKHKIIVGIVIVLLIIGGYFSLQALTGTKNETRYVLDTVQKGTIISSVTGTGQVVVLKQLDMTPKASGQVTYVGVKNGQTVKAGTLIARLDTQTAAKAIRDAKANLESAQLSLTKLKKAADPLSLLQAQNALGQAQDNKVTAQNNLTKAYDDGYTTVSNAFLNIPTIITGLDSIINGTNLHVGQSNLDYLTDAASGQDLSITATNEAYAYRNLAYNSFQKSSTEYYANFSQYKASTRFSDPTVIVQLIDTTYDTAKNMSEAVKNANNLLQYYKQAVTLRGLTPLSQVDTYLASLNSYTSQLNSAIQSLLNAQQTIDNDIKAISDADKSIEEKTQALSDLQAGTDPLDLQSAQLSIQQRQNSLIDAQQQLADYYVYAPFDGVISSVNVQVGDTASSGTVVATLITQQTIAQISLNEVDAAKVKIGQKVTLSFDALPDLTITGKVTEIETLGTVSQGVVTYTVKIGFDTQDDQVKPGMTVSADIITNIKQDILLVPSAAVKTQGTTNYVLMPNETVAATNINSTTGTILQTQPRQQTVVIGISDDTSTEITSGLN